MTIVVALAWSRAAGNIKGPQPAAHVQARLVQRIGDRLTADGARPVAILCESWQRPPSVPAPHPDDFLCRMTIEAAPGAAARGFASWLQWQHPQWRWSAEPFPLALAIDAIAPRVGDTIVPRAGEAGSGCADSGGAGGGA
ncbi:MAG TPA: hypothetical protein VIH40_13520 [Xanthobacteraceae bacterium]